MAEAIVLGSAVYAAVAAVCLLTSRRRYLRLRATGPPRAAVGAADLSPFELGMLAGGGARTGEVALAELFLSGRIVARGHGDVARPDHPGTSAPPVRGPAPVTRLMETRVPRGRGIPAEELAASAALGDPTTALVWRLRRLGLMFAPAPMRRIRMVRTGVSAVQTALGAAGILLPVASLPWVMLPASGRPGVAPVIAGVLLLGYPFLLHAARAATHGLWGAVAAAGPVAVWGVGAANGPTAGAGVAVGFGAWIAVAGAHRLSGGVLGPRTRAGDAVLAEARALEVGQGADAALRAVAVLGFRRLRRRGADGSGRRQGRAGAGPVEFALVRSFAEACGSGIGRPDGGLGGDFDGEGRSDPLPRPTGRPPGRRDRGSGAGDRIGG